MAKPSPFIVAAIKQSLLDGASPISLARLYDLNVETVRRYGRGETRRSVVVEGEERLRNPAETRSGEMATGASASLETLKKLLESKDGTATGEPGATAPKTAFLGTEDYLGNGGEPRNNAPKFGLSDE